MHSFGDIFPCTLLQRVAEIENGTNLRKPIMVLEKKLGRQPIWNGGTIPCVSG